MLGVDGFDGMDGMANLEIGYKHGHSRRREEG